MWWRRIFLFQFPHTCTTRIFRKIIFHKVRKGWSELQGHSQASLHRMRCERCALCLMLHLKSRSSVFSSQMLYEVIIYVFLNAVVLYIFKLWTSLTEGCFQFQMLMHFVCVDSTRMRLCATLWKWFNVLASQNGFMMQNEFKRLKGLNRQDKPHYFLYFKRDTWVNAA